MSNLTEPQPRMVTVSRKKTNHVLHLLLSVFTLGLWLPVWAIVAIVNSMRKERVYSRPA